MPKHRTPISDSLDEIFPSISSRMSQDDYKEFYHHQIAFMEACRARLKVEKGKMGVSVAFWSVEKNDPGFMINDGIARSGFLLRTLCYQPGQSSTDALPENVEDLFFVTDDKDQIVEMIQLTTPQQH